MIAMPGGVEPDESPLNSAEPTVSVNAAVLVRIAPPVTLYEDPAAFVTVEPDEVPVVGGVALAVPSDVTSNASIHIHALLEEVFFRPVTWIVNV